MYLKRRSQKFRKHQVKSPCSSSTTYACTQFHQPHIKTAIKLHLMHSRMTSWKNRPFKLHLFCEILLQKMGIYCSSNIYGQLGRKVMQVWYVNAGISLLSYFYSTAQSYLIHTIHIFFLVLNISSIPVWKGRALSFPPVTSSQISHQ